MIRGGVKEKTIAAIVDVIELWESGNHIGIPSMCPLCRLYYMKDFCGLLNSGCLGCPSCSESGSIGCVYFKSYDGCASGELPPSVRVDFWLHNLPYILSQPEEKFTPSGWSYFELEDVI